MINEVKKPNDIFVSVLTDPNADIVNLMSSGLNVQNTSFFTPEEYKKSNFVQKLFIDKDGNFQDQEFNKAYIEASLRFAQMAEIASYKDLEKYIEYSPSDVLAPIGSKKWNPTFEIEKIQNPRRVTYGVSSFWEAGDVTKSDRELAQMHKIWDSKNNKWLDKTADELGILGTIFSEPLVYATYDKDDYYINPFTGQKEFHRKGEWKVDNNGQFYTETIGNRSGYGKQFVAASDTLTREDSFWNKIDVFDSDDIDKSIAGTVFKTAIQIAPYIFPQTQMIWGGMVAAFELAKVAPTFAKMIEGIVVGDNNTEFTSAMNLLENYGSKYNESYSDAGLSFMSFEQLSSTITDVFGQLYQMNALASLSRFSKYSVTKAEAEAISRFENKFARLIVDAIDSGNFHGTPQEFYKRMLNKSPEIKAIMDKQSQLAKSLSLGYMALTSSADVYGDALQGGYDRRTAAVAGLAATLGQYLIMMNNPMGDWFLQATTGYTEKFNKASVKRILGNEYESIAQKLNLIPANASTQQKLTGLAKILNPILTKCKSLKDAVVDGSEDFWKRAFIEGVEEVTEEAVMDTTKGIFDFLTWMGLGNRNASFGGFDNVFSKSGLERYVMNFVGGVLGGALFEAQGRYINPFMKGEPIKDPYAEMTLNHLLANGHFDLIMKYVDKLADSDTAVAAVPQDLDGKEVIRGAENGEISRGSIMRNVMKEYIKSQNALLNGDNLAVTDQQLFNKAVRDEQALSILQEQHVDKLITLDYTQAVTEYTRLKRQISEIKESNPEADTKELEALAKEKLKYIKDFLNGEFGEQYLNKAFILSIGQIRNKLLGALNIDQYSLNKYGIRFRDIDDSSAITKEQVKTEHDAFLTSSEPWKYINELSQLFDIANQRFSGEFLKFNEDQLKLVRQHVITKLLASMNFQYNGSEDGRMDPSYREFITLASRGLLDANVPGESLLDMLQIDPKLIAEHIVKDEFDRFEDYFKEIARIAGENGVITSSEEVKESFIEKMAQWISNTPAETITSTTVDLAIQEVSREFIAPIVQDLIAKEEFARDKVDEWLTKFGFVVDNSIETPDEQSLTAYFADQARPTLIDFDENINLRNAVINGYIDSLTELDANLFREFKREVYDHIDKSTFAIGQTVKNYKWIAELAPNIDDDGNFIPDAPNNPENATYEEYANTTEYGITYYSANNRLLLLKKFEEGLNRNASIDEIVQSFLFDDADGILTKLRESDEDFKALELKIPNIGEQIKQGIIELLAKDQVFVTYQNALSKTIVENPLFQLLSKIDSEMSDSTEGESIWKLLQTESQYLSSLQSIEQYRRLGITLERINHVIDVLDVAMSIVAAMDSGDLTLGSHIFGMNQQIAAYLNKYKQGKNADKYALLDSEASQTILSDLNLVKNKLLFIKELAETNNKNKAVENEKTEKAVQQTLINKLLDIGGKLTVKGISVIPDDVLEQLKQNSQNPGEILLKAEHDIKEHLKTVLTKDNAEEIAKDLIQSLESKCGVKSEEILKHNLPTHGFKQDTNSLSDYDILCYLVSIISTDQFEFAYKYEKVLETDTGNIPLYIQEYATKIAYAFYKDDIGLHDAITKELFKRGGMPPLAITTKIFFLNGVSGVGKTSVVASNVAQMIGDPRMLLLAPSDQQVGNLTKSVTKLLPDSVKAGIRTNTIKSFIELLVKPTVLSLLNKDYMNPDGPGSLLTRLPCTLPDGTGTICTINAADESLYRSDIDKDKLPKIIIIDEGTHINSIEYQLLDHIADKYGIKLFVFGDTLQKSAKIGNVQLHIDTVFRWQTPRLLDSMRPSDEGVLNNTEILLHIVRKYEQFLSREGSKGELSFKNWIDSLEGRFPIKYYDKEDDNFTGTKFVGGFNSAHPDSNLIQLRKSAVTKGSKIGILTEKVSAEGELLDGELVNALTSAGITPDMYEVFSPDNFHSRAVQGSERDFFIIDLDDSIYTNNLGEDYVQVYTYITRALRGSLVKMSSSRLETMHLIDDASQFLQDYDSVIGNDLELLRKKKIESLKNVIGTYSPKSTPAPISTPSTATATPATPAVTTGPVASAPAASPAPLTPPAFVITPLPEISETEEEKEKVKLYLADPEKEVEKSGLNTGETEVKSGTGFDYWIYQFYNHLGLEKTPSGTSYLVRKDGPNIDLSGLFKDKSDISETVVTGFIKLNNTLSLYKPGTVEFEESLKNKNSKEILDFIREAIPSLSLYDDIAVINWILANIKVDDTEYAIAIPMNQQLDYPASLFDYQIDQMIKDKKPLVMYAKKVSFIGTDFELYFTQAAFPNEDTISAAPSIPAEYKIKFSDKMTQIQSDLESSENQMVVYQLTKKPLFRTHGRILKLKHQDEFHPLSELMKSGVNIEEIGIISDKKVDGKYAFVEFMKQFNPSCENVLMSSGIFTASGKYYAVLSFEGSNNKTFKRVLILDTIDQSFKDAMRWIHSNTGNLNSRLKVGKQLAEFNLTLLLMYILEEAEIFEDLPLFLRELKNQYTYYKSLSGVSKIAKQVNALGNLITQYTTNPDSFTRDNLRSKLNSPEYNLLGIYLAKAFTKYDQVADKFYSRLGKMGEHEIIFKDDLRGYLNFYPSGDIRENGSFPVIISEEDFGDIGLRGHYFEMPIMNLTSDMLDSMSKETSSSASPITGTVIEPKTETPSGSFDLKSYLTKLLTKEGLDLTVIKKPETLNQLLTLLNETDAKELIVLDGQLKAKHPKRGIGKLIQTILDNDSDQTMMCE